MDGTSSHVDSLIDAALSLAVERGWRTLTLPEVADAAGVSLADAHATFSTKTALLNAFMARIDRQMLSGEAPDMSESVRDRLFDVIMRRFDALEPHKDAVAAIVEDLPADPVAALAVLPAFGNTMAWILETAGLSASGLSGALRIKGLAVVYLTTLRTWLQDDTTDAARTMATLDRALRRAEMVIRAIPRLPGHRSRDREARWMPEEAYSGESSTAEIPAGGVPIGEGPSGDVPGAGAGG